MKQILRMRRHGKTYDCIKLCIDNDAILITPYSTGWIRDMARKEFGREINVVTMADFLSGKMSGRKYEKIVFDDVQECLHLLARGNEIIGLSMNIE